MIAAPGRDGITGFIILKAEEKLPLKFNTTGIVVMENSEATGWENYVIKPLGEVWDITNHRLEISSELGATNGVQKLSETTRPRTLGIIELETEPDNSRPASNGSVDLVPPRS